MPIIEAQMTGRPVITSNIEPMKSVAGNGACLVDPYNTEAIISGLNKIIDDDNYRKELVLKGRKNAEKYKAENIAKEYVKIYETISSEAQ